MRIRGCAITFVSAVALSACVPEDPIRPSRDSYSSAQLSIRAGDVSETVEGARVTPAFFTSARLGPLLGRYFIEPEYERGTTAVAIISYRYWTERFKSDPSTLGSRIDVDGRPYVIVGVGPPSFEPEGAPKVWIPQQVR